MDASNLVEAQVVGSRYLLQRKGAYLCDRMGFGKSAQALYAATLYGANLVFVVCPKPLLTNWTGEHKKWKMKIPMATVNYEKLDPDVMIKYIKNYKKVFVIFDEAHRIKNGSAAITTRSYNLLKLLQKNSIDFHHCFLSATPITREVEDVWKYLKEHGLNFYKDKVFTRKDSMKAAFFQKTPLLRADGSEVWRSTPNGSKQVFEWIIKPEKQADYQKFLSERFLMRFHNPKAPSLFQHEVESEQIMQLVQMELEQNRIIEESGLDFDTEELLAIRRSLGICKVPYAIDILKKRCSQTKYAVVFAKHRTSCDALEEACKAVSKFVYKIDGGVSLKNRDQAIMDFKKTGGILVGTLGTISTGLNMGFCNYCCFAELETAGEINAQAIGRFQRRDGDATLMADFITCKGSYDSRILELIDIKKGHTLYSGSSIIS